MLDYRLAVMACFFTDQLLVVMSSLEKETVISASEIL